MPWISMINRARKIGQLPRTHWSQGRAKCLGQYFLMRGTSFHLMRGISFQSSAWHQLMTKYQHANWAEMCNWLENDCLQKWFATVWGLFFFFSECNKFCNNNSNNNIMMMMIIIITLKNDWPVLFDRRGSTTFGQRFRLHLWNRVPCQGSRRAHCQTAHGTERADSEEKDDPSDKVSREGKRKKKSVCHFSMLDLWAWGREEWEYGAGIVVTAITTVLTDWGWEQSSSGMLKEGPYLLQWGFRGCALTACG